MPLANITLLKPFNIDSFAEFTFGNISAGNIKTNNLLYSNGVAMTFATSAQGALADSAVQPGSLATVATSGLYSDLTGRPTHVSDFTNDAGYLVAANLTGYATETYVNTQVSNLVDAAPTTLNTLNELAAALGDDPNFATSVATSLGNKLNTSDFSSTANTWLSTKSTSNVSEGTNLYFTDSRANTAIDARVTKSFVDALGVVASTVTTNAQPNITSVGQLTTLTVSGTATVTTGVKTANIIDTSGSIAIVTKYNNVPGSIGISTDLTVGGNTSLGDASKVSITGGTSGYVLSTDGTGNLSWVEQTGGTGGGTNTPATLESTVDTFTADGSTTDFTLTVTPTSENLTFVNLDGVMQLRGSYSLTGNVVTLSGTPVNGAIVEITSLHANNITSPNTTPSMTTGKAIAMSIVFGG